MKKPILFAGGVALSVCTLSAQSSKPNIVLILADDMRGSAINSLGEEQQVLTPNLDEFADESCLFDNAHIMGGTSGAVSMPSRAMLFTGKYLHTLTNQGGQIPVSDTTIGEVLQQNGYTTFHTGKWHSDKKAFNRCFSDGKSIYFGGMGDHWNVPLHDYHSDGKYGNNRPVVIAPQQGNELRYEKGDYILSGKHSVDIFTDVALDFLDEQQGSDKPFFLSVCFMAPHDPRTTYQSYLDLYDAEQLELPENFMPCHPFDNGELKIRDEKLLPPVRTPEAVREQLRDYYALISHMDNGMGRIIDELKRLGMYENTIVIFSADNGLAMGQHGLLGKQNVYEHSVRVPLMIKQAGEVKAERRDQLCYLIDIYPTILEMVGAQRPASVVGESLMPAIERNKDVRDELYYGYLNTQRAISDGEWKLIEYMVKGVRTTQLFNIKDDPKEMKNLAENPRYAARIAKMRKAMKQEAVATSDPAEFIKDL